MQIWIQLYLLQKPVVTSMCRILTNKVIWLDPRVKDAWVNNNTHTKNTIPNLSSYICIKILQFPSSRKDITYPQIHIMDMNHVHFLGQKLVPPFNDHTKSYLCQCEFETCTPI